MSTFSGLFHLMVNVSKEDKEFLKKLGERIKNVREDRGLTQTELGFRCDIERTNMNRIEKGNTNPTILTLKKILKELDIEINLDHLIK